jgi:hypothetical protein
LDLCLHLFTESFNHSFRAHYSIAHSTRIGRKLLMGGEAPPTPCPNQYQN